MFLLFHLILVILFLRSNFTLVVLYTDQWVECSLPLLLIAALTILISLISLWNFQVTVYFLYLFTTPMYSFLCLQSEKIAVVCPKRTWEFRKMYYLLLYLVFVFSLRNDVLNLENFLFIIPETSTTVLSCTQWASSYCFTCLRQSCFFALPNTNVPIYFLYYFLQAIYHAQLFHPLTFGETNSDFNTFIQIFVSFLLNFKMS